MSIELFNARTHRKEPFESIEPGKVKMYCCGPTIHDYAHIGNFRTFVFSDLMRRYLKFSGYEVYQVTNLTDVEDKIIAKSQSQGLDFLEFTKIYEKAFFEDLDTLNVERSEVHPRATDQNVMDKMAAMIEDLLEKGHAYKADDGSIYFSIKTYPDYGKFARIEVKDLRAGERISSDEYEKGSAADFALWKAWSEADGPVYWDQYPGLGKGRPGWHLECSAMGLLYLGETFDLHLGGIDLLFPHHQNEIAQSECCTGKRFVNYWVHSQHLQVEGEKMSKSLGNFYTLRDMLDGSRNASGKAWEPMAIRLALLKVHHGSRLNFTFDDLHSSAQNLERIRGFIRRCREIVGDRTEAPDVKHPLAVTARADFKRALDSDLNISLGLAAVFTLISEANKRFDSSEDGSKELAFSCLEVLTDWESVLGLRLFDEEEQAELTDEEQQWLQDRIKARAQKEWAEADRIRDLLLSRGITVVDTPDGAKWEKEAR
jgi:cysteinyl-tRNA synthetase